MVNIDTPYFKRFSMFPFVEGVTDKMFDTSKTCTAQAMTFAQALEAANAVCELSPAMEIRKKIEKQIFNFTNACDRIMTYIHPRSI